MTKPRLWTANCLFGGAKGSQMELRGVQRAPQGSPGVPQGCPRSTKAVHFGAFVRTKIITGSPRCLQGRPRHQKSQKGEPRPPSESQISLNSTPKCQTARKKTHTLIRTPRQMNFKIQSISPQLLKAQNTIEARRCRVSVLNNLEPVAMSQKYINSMPVVATRKGVGCRKT